MPYYLTYKQAQGLDSQVRKGAKAETVYFFKTLHKDADGKSLKSQQVAALDKAGKSYRAIPMPRTFRLFNAAAFLVHLHQDKRFLFQAATAAQKAVDFLLRSPLTPNQ